MRKLLLTTLCALGLLTAGGGRAMAQAPGLEGKKIVAVGEALSTTPEEGKWYLLKQERGGVSPAYDRGAGEMILRAETDEAVSVNEGGKSAAEDFAAYLLQVVATGDTSQSGDGIVAYLQWGTGNYWANVASPKNLAVVYSCAGIDEAGKWNVYVPVEGSGKLCINTYDMSWKVDNNGAGTTVDLWGTGECTETSGNNVWTFHEVTLDDLSADDLAARDNTETLDALVAEAQAAYDAHEGTLSTDVETGFRLINGVGNGLITSTSQFSSPYTESNEGSLSNLLNNTASSFWHSAWSSGDVPNGVHYLQVDMTEDFGGGPLMLDILRRNADNDHVTEMTVTDGERNYIATLELPYEGSSTHAQATFKCPAGVTTLRFYEEHTTGTTYEDRGYFHLANFQLFDTTYEEEGNNQIYTTVADALEQAIADAKATVRACTATEADIEALQAALDSYNENINGLPMPVEDGEYLLVNTETGYYLGGGLTWGTEGTLLAKPQFFALQGQRDGTYTLDSHQYNSEAQHYLGTNLYVDSDAAEWTLELTEEGNITLYNAQAGGYLTGVDFQKVLSATEELSAAAVWTLVTRDDVIASMDNAPIGGTVDVTALIAAPELKRNSNTEYYPTWTVTGYDVEEKPSNYAFGSGSNTANCAESYHSTNGFDIRQTLTDLKAGTYRLSAQGFYRNDDSSTLLLPVLYAGDEEVEFPELYTTANSMAEAYQDFLNGAYPVSLEFTVSEDNEPITIGFKGEDTSLWNIFGELTLEYEAEPILFLIHECEAEFDHWSIAGNSSGAFQRNTWSVEDDPSGMVTPFIEYWVGGGNVLTDATISHTTLTDLEAGDYTVMIDARAFNEASEVEVSEGITFTANGEGVDLTTGTKDVYDGVSTEVYGTYTVNCTVGDAGTLDISFVVSGLTACDWVAFKNLKVYQSVNVAPEIAAAEGMMNTNVEAAQTAALEAYAELPSANNYYAAVDAVAAAEESIAYYASITDVLNTFDANGQATFATTTDGEAYAACTLTDEDISQSLAEACKAQTTAGADMTYLTSVTAWTGQTGTYADGVERYGDEIEVGDEVVKVLYQSITGMQAGIYEVSFYGVANNAWVNAAFGNDIAQAFANSKTEDIEVYDQTGCTPTDYPHTFTVTVGEDGVLEYGLQNIATGGNWYVCQAISLTLVELGAEEEEEGGDDEGGDDTPVGIDQPEVTADSAIYTVAGVRVNDTSKPGIYIVNGKKVLVK